jgi:hypothetical protein
MRTSTHVGFGFAFAVALLVACVTQTTGTPAPSPVVQAPPSAEAPPTPSAEPPAEKPVVEAPPASSTSAPPPASSTVATAPSPPLSPANRQKKPPPTNQRDCKACNGDWRVHGLAQKPSCNCRTSDGGKRCRDGVECEGLCTAADDPERHVTDPGPPARGFFVGRCSTHRTIFGCYRPIDDGAGARPVDLTEPPQMICAD